mgnify:CR=1 FL=1
MTANTSSIPPLSLSYLAWFEGEDAAEDSGLGCNRDYRDLRAMSSADLRRVIRAEANLIDQVLEGGLNDGAFEMGPDWQLEVEELELGTASAVVALSVIGCIPYTSCNGGVFGGTHAADRLMVGFYMRPAHVEIVREASRSAGVGLTNDRCGGVYVVADDPRSMIAFAVKLGGLVD